ncbi:MAG: helix-turn-helix domain-containing protein [Anaerolineaceae bacterium]|nr:helix-turn-helix domain-containing protein [Anaerolineaceae bacterium]
MSSPDKNGIQNHDINLQAVQDSMLDGLGQLASYFGFSKVMGQLYGALMLNSAPLSLDDLVELLDISKASVSMNLRTLEHLGMVRQVWVKGRGDRRKFYEAETDFWQIISNILAGREMRDVERALHVMDDNASRLSKSMANMSEEDQELAKLYLERMEQMQSLFRFAQLLITSILGKAGEMDVSQVSRIDLE